MTVFFLIQTQFISFSKQDFHHSLYLKSNMSSCVYFNCCIAFVLYFFFPFLHNAILVFPPGMASCSSFIVLFFSIFLKIFYAILVRTEVICLDNYFFLFKKQQCFYNLFIISPQMALYLSAVISSRLLFLINCS